MSTASTTDRSSTERLKEHFRKVASQSSDFRSFLESGSRTVLKEAGLSALGLSWNKDEGFEPVLSLEGAIDRLGAGSAQRESFRACRVAAVEESRRNYLEARRLPPGKAVEDIEGEPIDPSNPVIFNGTSEDYCCIPVHFLKKPLGVIEAFGPPFSGRKRDERLAVLEGFAAGIAQFFKDQNVEQLSRQLSGSIAQIKLLEGLLKDEEADRHYIKIVNHVREIAGASRVCIFQTDQPTPPGKLSEKTRFDLTAVSGIDRINRKSSLAQTLASTGRRLLAAALEKQEPEDRQRAASSTLVVLAQREHPDPESRPAEVRSYFEEVPMNWILALALYDSERRIVGLLLCESLGGVKQPKAIIETLRPLGLPLGCALVRAGEEKRSRMLAFARRRLRARDGKRRGFRLHPALIILGLVAAVMALPIPFSIQADALLQPRRYEALPAFFSGRLAELRTREGDRVEAGELLARFETSGKQLALLEQEAEWRRLQSEAEAALQQGREREARLIQNRAEQAELRYQMVQREIEKATLHAPFDAWVIGPEKLQFREGTFFPAGETVVELADLNDWRLQAFFREEDLSIVRKSFEREGRFEGKLVLQASPAESLPVVVEDAEQFIFRAGQDPSGNAAFALSVPIERPEGVPVQLANEFSGKVEAPMGYRPLAYILFRDFVHFIRYQF